MIITIDGPAGSGKSTIAKKVAMELNFDYFDSGAMYRALTWFILENRVGIEDDEKIKKLLEEFSFRVENIKDEKRYFVKEKEVTFLIRENYVTKNVSQLSAKKYLREKIVKMQRDFSENKNVIFEGRDMGTVVFPFADLKFFLKANLEIRAKRRFLELKKRGDSNLEEILEDLKKRDEIDSTRECSPLKCAKNSKIIDTSNLSIEKLSKKIKKIIKKEIKRKKKAVPRFFKMKFLYGFVLFIVWSFFKIFYRLKVYGIENIKKGPAIIASNHVSYLDPMAVAVSFPDEVNYIAKASLFKIPIFASLIKRLNAIPIFRSSSDIATIKKILKSLKKGEKIILFPEGGRSKTGEISKIMPGVGYFTYLSKCFVIPTFVLGSYDIWKRGKKFPKIFGRISVVFGSSINFLDIKHRDKKEFIALMSEKIEKSLKDLKRWCEGGFEGPIP